MLVRCNLKAVSGLTKIVNTSCTVVSVVLPSAAAAAAAAFVVAVVVEAAVFARQLSKNKT